MKMLRVVKPEIRILGVDDGVFIPHQQGSALVVGVVFRGGKWLDGVLSTHVEVDGFDATEKIAEMILNSDHFEQLRIIFLNGVTVAGFNIVDMKALCEATELPVITVTRVKPDFQRIHAALKNLTDSEKRWRLIQSMGEPESVSIRNCKVFVQTFGINYDVALKVLRLTSTRSSIPEALRAAHLIASGVSST